MESITGKNSVKTNLKVFQVQSENLFVLKEFSSKSTTFFSDVVLHHVYIGILLLECKMLLENKACYVTIISIK